MGSRCRFDGDDNVRGVVPVMEQYYDVDVHNEVTNEMTKVSLPSASWQDAQVEALISLFHSHGWRKACALSVRPMEPAALPE